MMHAVRRSRCAIPQHVTVRRWSGRLRVSASRWSSSAPTPNDHVGALASPPLASLPRRGRCRPLGRLRPLSSAVVVAEADPLLYDDERGAWGPSSYALDAARRDEEKNRLVEFLAAELRAEMERLIRFNEERCAEWRRRRSAASADEEDDDDAPPLPDVFHRTSLANSLRRAADARRRERGRRWRAAAEVRGGHLVVPPSADDGVVPTTTDANGASSAAWFDAAAADDAAATGNDRGPLVQDDNNQKTTSLAPSTPSSLDPTTTITTNPPSSSSLLDLVESEEWRVIDDYVTQSASFGVNGHGTYLEESGLVNGVDDAAARLEQTLETATLLNTLIPSWSVFRDDPTEEDEDEDEEEEDEETDDHDEDDDELRPLTDDELAIVEERARRLLDGAWSLDVPEYELLASVASLLVKDGSLLLTVLDRVDGGDADVARRFAASRASGAAARALDREGAREPAAALASRAAALLREGVAEVDPVTVGAAISGAVAAGAVDATAELLATARARGHRDAFRDARVAVARAFRDARDSGRALATLRACADDAADDPRAVKGARRVIRTVVQWPLLLNEVGDREDYARHMTAVMDEFDRWENEDAGLRADRSARRSLVVALHAASRRSGDFLALVVRATREFLRRDEARRLDAEVVEIGLTAAEETRDARLAVDVLRWGVACQDRQRRSEDDHHHQHHNRHHYHHHRVSTRVFLRTLRVCLDAEDLDAGLEVLSSCRPDAVPDAARTRLHTLLLAGLAARGDHSAARSVLDDMRSNGPPPSPNAYAAVVHALAVADRPDEAAALVEEMRTEDGVAPNAACFAALMLSRLRTGEWDEVRSVEDAMERSGVSHSATTLRGSLEASARLGDVDRTVADLRAALDADVPLDRDAARTAARTLLGDDVDPNDDDDRRRTALDRLRRRRPTASPRVDALARTLRAAEVEEARTLSRRPRTERRRTRSWRRAVEAVLDLHEVLTRDEETGDDHGDGSGGGTTVV